MSEACITCGADAHEWQHKADCGRPHPQEYCTCEMCWTYRKTAAARALGARGGRAGRGASKVRGDADYYRRIRKAKP